MKYKITYLLIILLLSSCGFTPIYSNKNSNFNVEKITSNLNNSLTNYIENSLFSFSNTNASQSLNIEITLKEEIIVILKDSKGDPLKNKLITKIELIVNDDQNNLISTKNFNEDFDYSVQDNKFNMKQYEQNIRQNLIEDISGQILSYLSNLQ
tara:strand:+ start:312 stop:770 length:459 start_codon:yes stop_codon:yes gene_type:complete